jgi:diacylglycerol kinase (ATP)
MKGKVKKYKQKIKNTLHQKFTTVDFLESKYKHHTSELASSACGIYDCLIALGGDGTFNEVVNGIANKHNKPTIGFLPCGTVNDLARSLGISRRLNKSLKVILDGYTFNHDVFKVNNRYGIYVLAAGILTSCSYLAGQQKKRRFGWYAYAFEALKVMFRKNRLDVEITCDDKTFEGRFAFLLLANSNSVAGLNVNKNAELNDGYIDVVLLRQFGFLKITNLISALRLLKIFTFKIKKLKNTKYFVRLTAKNIQIKNKSQASFNLDGEYGGNSKNINLSMLKQEVEILVPRTNKNIKPYTVKKF